MIDGVKTRELQVNADERGHLVEVFRDDWDIYEPSPKMSYYSFSYPGVVRAWHRHTRGQVDHFICPSGKIKIGIYDDREESKTKNELNTFVIGEHNQMVVRIPGDCWHGFKAIGEKPSILLNFPTKPYNYENPDEQRLPADTDEIPMNWDESSH